MTVSGSLEQRLAARIRRALEPPRFPERRDVELAFAIVDDSSDVIFFDHFWLDGSKLWAVAARFGKGGLDGALTASGLRQLLRGLAAELREPQAVADQLVGIRGDDVSALAAICFDTTGGVLLHAACGEARCTGADRLGPGEIGWLAIAAPALPEDARVPTDGLQALVDGSLQPPCRAIAAIHFKSPPKRARSTTLVIANDSSAVPDALGSVRSFLAQHEVADEDVSALELALDEIVTNQINYGFRDGAAHEILLEIRVEEGRLEVELRDDGVPFDPLSVSPPDIELGIEERQIGGLGMHFVRSLMDEASYRRVGGWNVLALTRKLASASQEEDRA